MVNYLIPSIGVVAAVVFRYSFLTKRIFSDIGNLTTAASLTKELGSRLTFCTVWTAAPCYNIGICAGATGILNLCHETIVKVLQLMIHISRK